MADIVIRGLDMPRPIAGEAGYVDFRIFSDGTAVMASAKPPYYKQFEAVALPEGHGGLTDWDAIIKMLNEMEADFNKKEFYQGACWCHVIAELLKKAPTIVPAEGGADNA